ncbi:aerotolerance regulator BatA [Dictyobacter vulcani]|uniref:Aerotolerance regulator BatA n=1 Tax=Dictyobacter vulcani TaxID=2607529 RepID=A0A5J4KWU9_9CHLR|nr:VWA domain-containing protein [Dictyobacter vulcani]GER91010.1 aerotolerance regulator BatA [Dictyobacter vulcani]
MSFQWPLCLIMLALIPLLIWLYLSAQKQRRAYALRFTNLNLLHSVVGKRPGLRRHIPPLIFILALGAFVLGMARPMAAIAVPRDRANVMLVFDVSGSMNTPDMVPTRILAARHAAHLFVDALPDNIQVGVISFNNVASVRAPLTWDHQLAQRAIDTLLPGGGTAIGDGLNAALEQLEQSPRDDKGASIPATIVLLSDGSNNMGEDPQVVASRVRLAHIKVNTVGIGQRDTQPPVDGRPNTGVDEVALKAIANQTSGRYFYAGASKDLQQVYTDLSKQISWVKEPTEITVLFCAIGVLLFLLAGLLSLRWFQRFP